jgi:hypothetical protein
VGVSVQSGLRHFSSTCSFHELFISTLGALTANGAGVIFPNVRSAELLPMEGKHV